MPASRGGKAEDTPLCSFYWWLMKPKPPTLHSLKCSHSSFEVCCWLRVRADDLPKIIQCGGEKHSQLWNVHVWWPGGGIGCLSEDMLPREKDDCREEPELIGHCLTLSYVLKHAREKEIPQMNPLCRNYGTDILLCIYLDNSRSKHSPAFVLSWHTGVT